MDSPIEEATFSPKNLSQISKINFRGKLQVPELYGRFSEKISHQKSDATGKSDVLLRGSSFRQEVKTGWQCNLINQLINKYSNSLQGHTLKAEKNKFEDTMAYLKT